MLKSKYSKPIIIYIFYCIFIIILSIALSKFLPSLNLTYFIPISDIIEPLGPSVIEINFIPRSKKV
ncbi:hypothetical protein ES703_33349 [subsurface metagenome]